MKRLILAGLAIATLSISLSIAQNINKSVQLSQDPSGPIAFDNLNGIYFPGKLWITNNQTAPTLQTCGTTPAIDGSDAVGRITEGTGAVSSCAIGFSRTYTATPYCFAQTSLAATPIGVVATPGGILFSHLAVSASMQFTYFCMAKQQ